MSSVSKEAAIDEVLAAEAERCRAFGASDWMSMEKLISDDYTFTHRDGLTEGKAERLKGMKVQRAEKYVAEERKDLVVRIYGETAIVTGPMIRVFQDHAAQKGADASKLDEATVHIWAKQDGNWQVVYERR